MIRNFLFAVLLTVSSAFFPLSGKDVITIFSTTDIHGKIFSWKDGPNLLKLSTVLRQDRAACGGRENTLWIDSGDLIQGSPESAADGGELVSEFMGKNGLDVWTPGNHDFEFGPEKLRKNAVLCGGTVLCGNLKIGGKQLFPGWKIFLRRGKKIAVIGITSDYITTWSWKPEETGVSFEKTLSALDRIIAEVMREKPDFIILSIHAGRFQSKRFSPEWSMGKLAARYPQINLILGGHTHETVPGIPLADGVWYTQAGRHAETYGKASVTFEKGQRPRIVSETIRITGREKAQFPSGKMGRILRERQKKLDEKICLNGPPLGPKAGADELRTLFCESVMRATGAKIAFHGILSNNNKYHKSYTERDLFDLCPFENTAVILWISPSEYHAVMAEQRKPKNIMFQDVRGISEKNGVPIFPDGRAWTDENERIPAAFNSFAASSAGMRFPVLNSIARKKEVRAKDTKLKIRDLLRTEMKRKYP